MLYQHGYILLYRGKFVNNLLRKCELEVWDDAFPCIKCLPPGGRGTAKRWKEPDGSNSITEIPSCSLRLGFAEPPPSRREALGRQLPPATCMAEHHNPIWDNVRHITKNPTEVRFFTMIYTSRGLRIFRFCGFQSGREDLSCFPCFPSWLSVRPLLPSDLLLREPWSYEHRRFQDRCRG